MGIADSNDEFSIMDTEAEFLIVFNWEAISN